MSNVENLQDHMAFSCNCGCVRFNLLKSGGIECDDCGEKVDSTWGTAQPEQRNASEQQEPVAHMNQHGVIHEAGYPWGPTNRLEPLYTTPYVAAPLPQRPSRSDMTWVDLTDEQMWNAYTGGSDIINLDYAKSIVALFKEKNTHE